MDGAEGETEETKTGRRVVKMKPNLVEWLRPYAKHSGPVAPSGNIWKKLRTDKRKAGFGTPGSETEEEKAAGLKLETWTEDITRHTFGSYLLADCGDMGVTATQMGNSPAIVAKHYNSLVKPKDAERFWGIRPSTGRKIISIAA